MSKIIKGYGSIPHLACSTHTDSKDFYIEPTLDARFMTGFPKGKTVTITVKLDGSGIAIAKIDGKLVFVSRNGYEIEEGAHPHFVQAIAWFEQNKSLFSFLQEGEKINGELLNHRVRIDYGDEFKNSPVKFFDFFRKDERGGLVRVAYSDFLDLCKENNLPTVEILPFENGVEAIKYIDSLPNTEGIVLRVDGLKGFEHIVKYVKKSYKDLELKL